ncbi:uncharacterized protein LOC135687098 [Rhopilema esculentum]|uniref:uncharacterized protein LOC135687098 n=1 Tax=Rhopilema esculentum TaxID=499914 RepID=UPI0031E02A3E
MPDSKFGQLPVNLVEDTRYKNKSMYVSDFCSRRPQIPARRRAKTKETLRYAEDVHNPATRFLNDHYQTSDHIDLRRHCQKVLNTIERTNSRQDDLGVTRGRKTPLYNGIPATPVERDDSEPIAELLPASLRRIESAWREEVNATKRDRGNIYGKAGAKQWYHQRLKEDAAKRSYPKLVPGLNTWLNDANEYEKMVVHDFMKNVSETINNEPPSRDVQKFKEADFPVPPYKSDYPKIEEYLDTNIDKNERPGFDGIVKAPSLPDEEDLFLDEQIIQQSLLDNQLSQAALEREVEEYKNVSFRHPTRETIVSPPDRKLLYSRGSSRSSIALNNKKTTDGRLADYDYHYDLSKQRSHSAMSMHVTGDKVSDRQRPKSSLGIYDPKYSKGRPTSSSSSSRPSINITKRAKSVEVPFRAGTPEVVQRVHSAGSGRSSVCKLRKHFHNDPTCSSCQEREIKRMAEKLADMQPKSYDKLKKQQRDQPKMAVSKMYKASFDDYSFPADDYIYNQSVFGKVSAKDRGFFIIHPEWVSERAKPKKGYR